MYKISISLSILAILVCASISFGATADTVTVSELIEGMKKYDTQIVTIEVEAIGDKMTRGSEMVFNGLDATGAIGIWTTAEMSNKISRLGNYNQVGDTFVITGVYHLSCIDHGGDSDIHATSITRIKEGFLVQHPISTEKRRLFEISCLALMIVSGTFLWFLKKR